MSGGKTSTIREVAPTLYHGTTLKNARALLRNGWRPNEAPAGVNDGRPEYLYLSTDRGDAHFYGHMNDEYDSIVLKVTGVPIAALAVDPEDSQRPTVEAELLDSANFPGRVVLTRRLPASHFSLCDD